MPRNQVLDRALMIFIECCEVHRNCSGRPIADNYLLRTLVHVNHLNPRQGIARVSNARTLQNIAENIFVHHRIVQRAG
jgi:hypothetical protein